MCKNLGSYILSNMNTLIILRSRECDSMEQEEEQKKEEVWPHLPLPNSDFARKVMTDPHFLAYIEHHGYHFTDALADHASGLMENADDTDHHWTTEQVASAMKAADLQLQGSYTWGDAAYAANMSYADYFPIPNRTERDCLIAAHKTISDPDGYEGMVFNRWLADVIGKRIDIPWHQFVL